MWTLIRFNVEINSDLMWTLIRFNVHIKSTNHIAGALEKVCSVCARER